MLRADNIEANHPVARIFKMSLQIIVKRCIFYLHSTPKDMKNFMKTKTRFIYSLGIVLLTILAMPGWNLKRTDAAAASMLILDEAVMCEAMEGLAPKNKAVVFSLGIGEVLCFTSFDNIPKETVIYHKWYRSDQLSTNRKLILKPPRWSTVSRIQFREADKGPWRVEVVDDAGKVLKILRFSITD